MAIFKFKTNGNANPKGKPRVYFTCHEEDFSRYFDKLCDDILRTHDCAIYYTPDMTEEIAEDDKATDLGQSNLFVVPITFKLLTSPSRAMLSDIPYAKAENIPILPFMMESGIDEFYSKSDKFGTLQYLSPYSHDLTEIKYEEKLKKYLETVLISNELTEKIRAAFDAYIFLSYRKKDRKYANELMRLIHDNPRYRAIAIWYDEFLTPGESFEENIKKMLEQSKLFALLVTPNLLEEPEGKPNYIMEREYPDAIRLGMDILPAEMELTDKTELEKKFIHIPESVNPRDNELFSQRLASSLVEMALSVNESSPEHIFLIGLAYLEGIDVEIDRARALELITKAAEAELPEAMKKLYEMYIEGDNVKINYKNAVIWAGHMADYYEKTLGKTHYRTLSALNDLAIAYGKLGEYVKSKELSENVYNARCKVLGEKHPDTLMSLNNLANAYADFGEYKLENELKKRAYNGLCEIFGDTHPETLRLLNDIAVSYSHLGDYIMAKEYNERSYSLYCKIMGEEHPYTIASLKNLAVAYSDIGNHQKGRELKEKAYCLFVKIFGEEHPETLRTLHSLAYSHDKLGEYKKAMEIYNEVYVIRSKILGEKHPNTLTAFNNVAFTCGKMGDYKKAYQLGKKSYKLFCKVLGNDHHYTITALSYLASSTCGLEQYEQAKKMYRTVYEALLVKLGSFHPDTLQAMCNLAYVYKKTCESDIAEQLCKKAYELSIDAWGEEHLNTANVLNNIEQINNS